MVERAYAKINLALEVFPCRADGYHEVKNLMVPIDLYDKLYFEKTEKGIEVISNVNIKDNFVTKAAELFFNTYNITQGVKITLEKHIPISAGLAGGSSDAAACLRGLNRLFKVNASLEKLAKLSEVLGSDMPYCVYSRPSLCYGRGEKVEVLKDLTFDPIPLTLIMFKFGLSTKLIYQEYTYEQANHNDNFDNIITGLKTGNIALLNSNIFNDLAKPAYKINNKLQQVKDNLSTINIQVHQSGSGPTHYILDKDIFNDIYSVCNNVKLYQTHILSNTYKKK